MTRLENTLFNQIDFELQNASMLCSYGFELSWVILYDKMNFLKKCLELEHAELLKFPT